MSRLSSSFSRSRSELSNGDEPVAIPSAAAAAASFATRQASIVRFTRCGYDGSDSGVLIVAVLMRVPLRIAMTACDSYTRRRFKLMANNGE